MSIVNTSTYTDFLICLKLSLEQTHPIDEYFVDQMCLS